MEKFSLSIFYELGANLERLDKQLTPPPRTTDQQVDLLMTAFGVQGQLNILSKPPFSLKVSRAAIQSFRTDVEQFRTTAFPPAVPGQGPRDPVNVSFQANNIAVAVQQLKTVLQAEWGTLAAYFVPQQGIYQTDALIDEAHMVLPEEIRSKLDSMVLSEIREAGRCLAFGVPTASGFHIMRAVEAVLWSYCESVDIPGLSQPPKGKVWGAYTTYLDKSAEADVREVHALLLQLKDNHRNLIMHPEVVLDADGAYRLFQESQSAIIAMADRLVLPQASP